MAPVGADCGENESNSSKKGFVDTGRAGRISGLARDGEPGESVRFLKGLLDPRLTVNRGDGCRSERDSQQQHQSLLF